MTTGHQLPVDAKNLGSNFVCVRFQLLRFKSYKERENFNLKDFQQNSVLLTC